MGGRAVGRGVAQVKSDAGTVRIGDRGYEKMQLLWSIEDWFAGRRPELPTPIGTQQPRLI